MPARHPRRSRPNPAAVHRLRSAAILRALVRSADPRPTDTVFELGAGPGTVTAVLARGGAAVPAAERRLRALLAAVHRRPDARAATLARHAAGRRAGPRLLHAAGADPQAAAGQVAPHAWATVAAGVDPLRR